MRRFPLTVWVFAFGFAFVTSLPYIVGALSAAPGERYTGTVLAPAGIGVDYNSHLAKMWQGRRGDFAYELLFTHEPHPGIPLLQGFYTLLGALSIFDLPVTYHLARFVLSALMVVAFWRCGTHFFANQRHCWIFVLFSTFVTGVSWILLIVAPAMAADVSPIEFWLIDAYNATGALFMPHFAAAIILQIVAFLTVDAWLKRGRTGRLIALMLILAALSIVQPYIVVLSIPLIGLTSLYTLYRRNTTLRRLIALALPLGVHGALSLYQFLAINADPVWRSFSAQNITLSPPPIYYLLGYLPLLVPAAFGVWRLRKQFDSRWLLPILWVILVVALVYAPLATQRRYLLGVQTPLAALATFGWVYLTRRMKPQRQSTLTLVYTVIAAIPLILLIVINISAFNGINRSEFYLTANEQSGAAWLRREANPDDTILPVFPPDVRVSAAGGRVVAATGHRVFIGHWIETVDYQLKLAAVDQFDDPETTHTWRCELMRTANIVYVWYDDERIYNRWNPSGAAYLEPVFATDTITIYRFNPTGCP